jgi:hypothetical protein
VDTGTGFYFYSSHPSLVLGLEGGITGGRWGLVAVALENQIDVQVVGADGWLLAQGRKPRCLLQYQP